MKANDAWHHSNLWKRKIHSITWILNVLPSWDASRLRKYIWFIIVLSTSFFLKLSFSLLSEFWTNTERTLRPPPHYYLSAQNPHILSCSGLRYSLPATQTFYCFFKGPRAFKNVMKDRRRVNHSWPLADLSCLTLSGSSRHPSCLRWWLVLVTG